MRTTARVAAALLSTTIVVGGTATTAFAQSSTVKDRASDVVSSDLTLVGEEVQEQESVLSYRSSIASGVDLRSMRVSHGEKTVTVTLRFAELRRDAIAVVAFRLDGDAEPERILTNTSRRWGRVSDVDDKKKCTVPIQTKTGPKGTIRATIKRSCLGDPKRLKATAVSVALKDSDDSLSIRQDVLSTKNVKTPTWSKWLSPSR
jgi:Flp pilus assembly secretin CpaC